MKNTWKLWYGDGTSVAGSSRDEWATAPARNVQVLVTMQKTGREMEHGGGIDHKHAYLWFPGDPLPTGVDYGGLWDFCREVGFDISQPLEPHDYDTLVNQFDVKLGRSIPSDSFWQIVGFAGDDPEMPNG